MAKFLFVVLAAALVVAALAEMEFEDEETDLEFLKRDPEMQEYFMAEKRGRSMKKYKYCRQYNMDCWCGRRKGNIVFCNGAGDGSLM
ncbi:uncharacterized protein [Diadema antillarum]|uniref:uncharacterized protein n=1 Tax=Diadema antillarum TaxID=105358 RepID=UPI003A867459